MSEITADNDQKIQLFAFSVALVMISTTITAVFKSTQYHHMNGPAPPGWGPAFPDSCPQYQSNVTNSPGQTKNKK